MSLKRAGTRNNFTQLVGDSGLTGFVVLEVEAFEDFPCVLGGVLHSVHSRGLFAGCVLEHCVVEAAGHVELIVVLALEFGFWLFNFVDGQVVEVVEEGLLAHEVNCFDFLGDRVNEVVVVDANAVELVRRLADDVGNAGDVLIKSRKS